MTTYYLLIIFYVSFLYVTKGRLFNNYFLIFTFVFDTLTPSKMQTFQFLELYYMKKKKKKGGNSQPSKRIKELFQREQVAGSSLSIKQN